MSSFEEFNRAVEQHKGKTIFAYFTGSKDAGGKSWCPDCVQGKAGFGDCCPDEGAGRPRLWPNCRVEKRQEEACSWRPAGRSELSSCFLFLSCSLLSC